LYGDESVGGFRQVQSTSPFNRIKPKISSKQALDIRITTTIMFTIATAVA
jgi:hypothetical protein